MVDQLDHQDEYVEITDAQIEEASAKADLVWDELTEELNVGKEDQAAVIYSLWIYMSRCLATCGWNLDQLSKDLAYHVNDQNGETRQ